MPIRDESEKSSAARAYIYCMSVMPALFSGFVFKQVPFVILVIASIALCVAINPLQYNISTGSFCVLCISGAGYGSHSQLPFFGMALYGPERRSIFNGTSAARLIRVVVFPWRPHQQCPVICTNYRWQRSFAAWTYWGLSCAGWCWSACKRRRHS